VLLLACSAATATAAAPPASTPAADAAKVARFKIGAVGFEMPVPEGFCPPTAAQAAALEVTNQADTQNVTDLMLFACATAGAAPKEFVLLKSPKAMLDVDLTREDMLKLLGTAFESPAFKEGMQAGIADMSRSVQARSGQKLEMTGDTGPRGRDEVCAYIGGTSLVNGPGGSARVSMGACLTVVGGRFITLAVGAPATNEAAVPALMARARRLAETIRRTP
jgi:hypothetical protein